MKLQEISVAPVAADDAAFNPNGWKTYPPPDLLDWIQETMDKPEPDWIVPGLIPAGASVLISGKAKISFKTWLTYLLVLGFAMGYSPVTFLRPSRRIKTLVIEREDPAKQTAHRWQWLMAPFEEQGYTLGAGDIFFWHREQVYIDDPNHIDHICEFIGLHDIQCVIIDTLAKCNQGDENSTKDMSRTMGYIDVLHDAMGQTGAVIYCHHLRKSGDRPDEDIDEAIRGSSAISGFYDVHVALQRAGGMEQDWIDLTVRQSTAPERHFQLTWNINASGERASLQMEEMDPANITAEQLLAWLQLLIAGQKYSLKQLGEAWNVPWDVAKAASKTLVEEGTLVRTGTKYQLPGEQ